MTVSTCRCSRPSSCSKESRAARLSTPIFDRYAAITVEHETGFILESPTWRASPDWGQKLGYDRGRLARANRAAIAMMHDIRNARATAQTPLVVSDNIGPRGDGFDPGALMSPWEAEAFHALQIGVFADTGADLVSAVTLNKVKRGHRLHPCGGNRRDAMRDFIHGRNRRQASDRRESRRRHRVRGP